MGARPEPVDQALVDEILGGDPLLTPGEALAVLGWGREVLMSHARAGKVPCIVLPGGHRRYRTSVILALAAQSRQRATRGGPNGSLPARVLAWLADHPGSSAADVSFGIRCHRDSAQRALIAAEHVGVVSCNRQVGQRKPWEWALIPERNTTDA